MKKRTGFLIAGLVLALPLSACSKATEHMSADHMQSEQMAENNMHTTQAVKVDHTQDRKAVEAALQNYAQQITTKDMNAMAKYVLTDGEDFTIFEGKGTNIGWADYRDNHLAPELADKDLVFTKYNFTDFKTFVDGALAAVTFTIDAAYTYKGKSAAHKSHGTAILKKVDGQWKLAHMQS